MGTDYIGDDPYRKCEENCNHDLVSGILVEFLWAAAGDGPYKGTGWVRVAPDAGWVPDEQSNDPPADDPRWLV